MSTVREPGGEREDTMNAQGGGDAVARRGGGPRELSGSSGVEAPMRRPRVIARRRSMALIGAGILALAAASARADPHRAGRRRARRGY